MKRLVSKSWLIPILAMIMVIGMGSTAMAVPTFPGISEHEPDCQHTGVLHIYATGNTYYNSSSNKCAECCMYFPDGTTRECYEGSSEGTVEVQNRFGGKDPSEGWYFYDSNNNKFVPCKAHGEGGVGR